MPGVIWNLSYPVMTTDQLSIFRHHYETLRLDSHVAAIETASPGPNVMTMQVEFAAGFDRPASVELRYVDSLFPSLTQRFERHTQWALPSITGVSTAEFTGLMLEVSEALRTSDLAFSIPALPQLPEVVVPAPPPLPVTLPSCFTVGRAFRLKTDPDFIITLKAVHVNPNGSVSVESLRSAARNGKWPARMDSLEEFKRLFEPFDKPTLPRTAWERVLNDPED